MLPKENKSLGRCFSEIINCPFSNLDSFSCTEGKMPLGIAKVAEPCYKQNYVSEWSSQSPGPHPIDNSVSVETSKLMFCFFPYNSNWSYVEPLDVKSCKRDTQVTF